MADDEQFSLCWNNFNSNLSAGFHESLCRGDLVDVTLAAEGQFVKAHRLVLSVCSPYFRKMFVQMPANQHAFVFLKDVSHSALKDLIQFMYCGEVNVKQEALPAFISTAEALQIKGLTDSDPAPAQSPAKPSTPAPQPAPPAQTITQAITPPRVRQRNSTSRSYRIETDDSDDKSTQIVLQATPVQQQSQQQQQQQTQPTIVQQTTTTTAIVSQKRTAPRSISTPHTKRVKNTIDPLEASEPTQITVQTVTESKSTSDAEFIDLPIEMPTKSEPDYSEETGEVETAEQDTTYVEDDSYGDMKYDESYFTEQEETGAATGGAGGATTSTAVVKQSFVDNSYVEQADQSANEAQDSSFCEPMDSQEGVKQSPENLFSQSENISSPSDETIVEDDENKMFINDLIEECTSTASSLNVRDNVPTVEKFGDEPEAVGVEMDEEEIIDVCTKIITRKRLKNASNWKANQRKNLRATDVVRFIRSQKKNAQLVFKGFIYNKKLTQANGHTTWRCIDVLKCRCKAVVITKKSELVAARRTHNHTDHMTRIGHRPLYNEEEDLGEYIEIKADDPKLNEIITVSHLEFDKDNYKIFVPSLKIKQL